MPIFLAFLGVSAIVGIVAMIKPPPSPTKEVVSGAGPKRTALDYVCGFVRAKKPVPRFLVEKAMYEAAHQGDWNTFHNLAEAFRKAKPVDEEIAHDEQSSEETEASGQPEIVVGKNSPLQGVSNDEWGDFVEKLKTQDTAYQDEKHVGAFHHSKRRLVELGVDPTTLGDESAQYNALEADMKDVAERYKRLINEWAGDVITLNGQIMSITRSGLLGLIKCAGFEGAKEWLSKEGDRMRYPNTTAMFLKCNGVF